MGNKNLEKLIECTEQSDRFKPTLLSRIRNYLSRHIVTGLALATIGINSCGSEASVDYGTHSSVQDTIHDISDNYKDGIEQDLFITLTCLGDKDNDGFGMKYDQLLISGYNPVCPVLDYPYVNNPIEDCDDTDPDIYPGAPEICDGKDNNCDGIIDGGIWRLCESDCDTGFEYCINGKWSECDAEINCCEPGTLKDIEYCNKKTDFIFLIDSTGSMSSAIEGTKQFTLDLVEKLNNTDQNIRLGLITFKDDLNVYGITESPNTFKSWIEGIYADMGSDEKEAQLCAVVEGSKMDWTSANKRVLLLLTDAPFHKQNYVCPYSIPEVKSMLIEKDIQMIGIAYITTSQDLIELTEGTGEIYSAEEASGINSILTKVVQQPYKSWKECTEDKQWVTKYFDCK